MEEQQTNSQSQPLDNVENVNDTNDGTGNRQKTLVAKAKERFAPGIKYGLILSLAIYVILLVVGAYGYDKCPVERYIPLFLIVTGGVGIVGKTLSIIRGSIVLHLNVKYMETVLYSVETVFFIFGSYWVYKEYQPKYDESFGDKYCNKTVYMFAFAYLTILYAFAVAIVSGFVCFLICICFLTATDPEFAVDAEAQRNREPQNV